MAIGRLRRIASLSPAEAERMPSGIGVDMEVVAGIDILRGLRHLRAERHDAIVGVSEALDPEIEVELLLPCPVRSVGRNVVRRELDPDAGCTIDHHHVPVVLRIDGAVEHPGREPITINALRSSGSASG